MSKGMTWPVNIELTLTSDVKFRRLCRMLFPNGEDGGELMCLGILANLWCRTMQFHPSGILSGWTDTDLAEYAGWHGEPKLLADALSKCGDKGGAGFIIKNKDDWEVWKWKEYQNDPMGTLQDYREKKMIQRHRKDNGESQKNQIETPQEQAVARFMLLARKLKMPGHPAGIRSWIDGRMAQGKAQEVEAVLSNINNQGKTWQSLEREYFYENKSVAPNGGKSMMERAMAEAKASVEAREKEEAANEIR